MTYDEAVLYCQFLDYDGYTNWRLPTRTEWNHDWWFWFQDRDETRTLYVRPVRDI